MGVNLNVSTAWCVLISCALLLAAGCGLTKGLQTDSLSMSFGYHYIPEHEEAEKKHLNRKNETKQKPNKHQQNPDRPELCV